jgi:hypothetical protein
MQRFAITNLTPNGYDDVCYFGERVFFRDGYFSLKNAVKITIPAIRVNDFITESKKTEVELASHIAAYEGVTVSHIIPSISIREDKVDYFVEVADPEIIDYLTRD